MSPYDATKVAALAAKLRDDPQAALYVAAMISGATLAPSRCWGLFLSIGGLAPWEQSEVLWRLRDIIDAELLGLARAATANARAADDREAAR